MLVILVAGGLAAACAVLGRWARRQVLCETRAASSPFLEEAWDELEAVCPTARELRPAPDPWQLRVDFEHHLRVAKALKGLLDDLGPDHYPEVRDPLRADLRRHLDACSRIAERIFV